MDKSHIILDRYSTVPRREPPAQVFSSVCLTGMSLNTAAESTLIKTDVYKAHYLETYSQV